VLGAWGSYEAKLQLYGGYRDLTPTTTAHPPNAVHFIDCGLYGKAPVSQISWPRQLLFSQPPSRLLHFLCPQPLLGKKRRVLRSCWPCYQDCWHTGWLYVSLIVSNTRWLKSQRDELFRHGTHGIPYPALSSPPSRTFHFHSHLSLTIPFHFTSQNLARGSEEIC